MVPPFDLPVNQGFRQSHFARIQTTLQRLETRGHLGNLAREIYAGVASSRDLQPASLPSFLAEGVAGTICGSTPPQGKDPSINFECSKNDFNCPTNFKCTDNFGDCGGAPDSFDCKNDYDCKDFFDCHDFGCGDSGAGKGAFDCDSSLDFLCGGPNFNCHDEFDCTAGHVFLCLDNNQCVDSFECKSTGDVSCNEPGGYPYSISDDGGIDKTPGDFRCGLGATGGGTFDCKADFDCLAKDQFDCTGTTDFNCKTNFDCGKNTRFECDNAEFDCDATFNCLGTYVPPPGS